MSGRTDSQEALKCCCAHVTQGIFDFYDSSHSTVAVLVGSPAHSFVIHQARLVRASGYFHKALNGEWKEHTEGKFQLDDVEPGLFAIFVHWIYHETIAGRDRSGDLTDSGYSFNSYVKNMLKSASEKYPKAQNASEDTEDFWEHEMTRSTIAWHILFGLYTLGDRLQSTTFKNTVIDLTLARLTAYDQSSSRDTLDLPSCQDIRCAFDKTPPRAPLRTLLVDAVAELGSLYYISAQFDNAQHPDFMIALGKKMAPAASDLAITRCKTRGTPLFCLSSNRETCQCYHEHEA